MSSRIGSRRSLRKAGFAGVVAAVFGALMVGAPSASAEFIPGAGNPYNSIFVSGNDLVCQIVRGRSTDFDSGQEEDYCGTFVYTDFTDELYGNSSAGPSTFADFEQVVAQTLTGTGDPSNPWVLTSVVEVPRFVIEAAPAQEGSSLLTITEVDTYTVGDDFYRTDLTVHNDLTDPGDDQGVTLYHVGDCQLEGSDTGFAVQDTRRQRSGVLHPAPAHRRTCLPGRRSASRERTTLSSVSSRLAPTAISARRSQTMAPGLSIPTSTTEMTSRTNAPTAQVSIRPIPRMQ